VIIAAAYMRASGPRSAIVSRRPFPPHCGMNGDVAAGDASLEQVFEGFGLDACVSQNALQEFRMKDL